MTAISCEEIKEDDTDTKPVRTGTDSFTELDKAATERTGGEQDLSSNNRVLNVGAGNQTYGTDFVDIHPKREEVKKVDLDEDKLPFEGNTFDKTYSKCVFEHFKNPGRALSEMIRVTKPGGKIEIITDNASYWRYSVPGSVHSGGYGGRGSDDSHFCLFTDHHLINFAESYGLEEIEVDYLERQVSWKEDLLKFFLRKTKFWRLTYGRIKLEAEVSKE